MPKLVSADTGAREYTIYRAEVSWEDVCSYYAAHTAPEWGWYGRRYLKVEKGCMYGRLVMSPCAEAWWYMIPVDEHIEVLARGGWAPASVFKATRYFLILDEDEAPLLEPLAVVPPFGGIEVHVGGSADDRQGIAAGCYVAGEFRASRASLALPGMTGAEASEFLGITLGLLEIYRFRNLYSSAVLVVDSQYAIKHVFQSVGPGDRPHQDVLPAIVLARRIVCVLEDLNIRVSAVTASSRENLAPELAQSEMEYRRAGGWLPDEDRWPCDAAFKTVFQCVARNCSYSLYFNEEVVMALMALRLELYDGA